MRLHFFQRLVTAESSETPPIRSPKANELGGIGFERFRTLGKSVDSEGLGLRESVGEGSALVVRKYCGHPVLGCFYIYTTLLEVGYVDTLSPPYMCAVACRRSESNARVM